MGEVLIPYVNYFVVLDSDGNRLLAKYYDGKKKGDQIKNEIMLHKKTKAITTKNDAEVLLLDTEVVVFKSGSDCKFFISGLVEENELILVGVLDTLFDSISMLMRSIPDKRTMLDNLELVLLTIDETIDNGYIMELDSNAVCSRVLMKGTSDVSANQSQAAIGDLSIGQALSIARDQFMKTLTTNQAGGGY